MGLFGTTKKDDKPTTGPSQAPSSITRVTGATNGEANGSPRVGIDHAIMLMRSLPTDKNVGLVVTVLRTTLESLNIRVADIITDASKRQQDIEARVTQLKSEISSLEQEIAKRSEEIGRFESAHAETTKVKDLLEVEETDVVLQDV